MSENFTYNLPSQPEEQILTIIYDGECPFCSAYVQLLRLKETVGKVVLIDARSDHPQVLQLAKQNINIDKGIVVKWHDQFYQGHQAMNMLSSLSTPSTLFNKINAVVFRSKTLSKWIYPVLYFGRNTALFLLGRKRLENKESKPSDLKHPHQ